MGMTEQQFALKELGKRLSSRLDEDEWNYIEPFLREVESSIAAMPASEQKPVARVDANDDCCWADILPDNDVKVGQLLYANPGPDSAARIRELEAEAFQLKELLAVIHGDGGHHLSAVGINAAVRDAMRVHYKHAEDIDALKEKLRVAREAIKNAEQAVFEEWLQQECPSGDVESVQNQWRTSKLSDEFNSYFGEALAAIREE